MRGDEQVVGLLNEALAADFTAVNHDALDAGLFDNWGSARRGGRFRSESIGEMRDPETQITLIGQIGGSRPVAKQIHE